MMFKKPKRNYFLYSLLWIQSLLFLYIIYKKRKDKKIIIHYFSMAGLAYIFEFIVLVLLRAYKYRPKFLNRPYLDNVLGANISQFFIVPAIATFISSLKLNLYWKLLFSLYLMAIETIFKFFKIYKNFWWKTTYTGIFILGYFLYSDYFYKMLQRNLGEQRLLKVVTVYLKTFTLYSTYIFYLIVLFKAYFFKVSWFKKPGRSHVAFATLYSSTISLIYTTLFFVKRKWFFMASTIVVFFMDSFLVKKGVLIFRPQNNIYKHNFLRSLLFLLLFKLDNWLYTREAD